MDVMYVRHRVGGPARLLSGETLLHEQDRLRAASIYCSPFCQALWSPALFLSVKVLVTDRRVLLSCRPLPSYWQETDLWFPGQQPGGKREIIASASLEAGRFGPCLEIKSRNPHRRDSWFASSALIVRIYCAEPEHIGRIVCGNLVLSGNIAIEGTPNPC